jgi:hypothetical protein
MRRKTRFIITIAAIAAIPTLPAAQGRGGGSGAPPMVAEPTPFERFVDKLLLDTDQLTQIQKFFGPVVTEGAPVSRELVAHREKMIAAEAAGKADDFTAAAAGYAATSAKMTALEIKAFKQAEGILKPKQLNKTAEAFSMIGGLFNQPTTGPRLPRGPNLPTPPTTRLGIFATLFTLTDDQKKQVKSLLDAEYKAAAPLRDQLTKSRLALGMAIQTKKSLSEVDAAAKAYADQTAALAQAESKALAKIMALASETARGNQTAMTWAVNMSRGIFAGKKWDTAPDNQFY